MGDDEIYLEWGAGAMTHRARYASIAEALVQARHDLSLGLDVHRIAGPDDPAKLDAAGEPIPGTGATLSDLKKIKAGG